MTRRRDDPRQWSTADRQPIVESDTGGLGELESLRVAHDSGRVQPTSGFTGRVIAGVFPASLFATIALGADPMRFVNESLKALCQGACKIGDANLLYRITMSGRAALNQLAISGYGDMAVARALRSARCRDRTPAPCPQIRRSRRRRHRGAGGRCSASAESFPCVRPAG